VASYVFYGYWSYKFLGLLMFSTTLDYFLGIWIYRQKSQTNKKRLVVLSVLVNLGILGFFKYFNFFADNFYTLNNLINQDSSRSFFLEIVLPVGISFYTFQSMSYTLDVYYGSTKPHYDYLSFATYVAFFPQLVAGPIVRHSDLVYQLEDPKRGIFESTNFSKGVNLFVFGLSKKMLLADRLAEAVDPALNSLTFLSTAESWLVAIGYTLQLYFDFSGYSDMAIGLGKMMNFDYPINFNSP
jgi:alginate O-acetyltransferase complex protein AlgI